MHEGTGNGEDAGAHQEDAAGAGGADVLAEEEPTAEGDEDLLETGEGEGDIQRDETEAVEPREKAGNHGADAKPDPSGTEPFDAEPEFRDGLVRAFFQAQLGGGGEDDAEGNLGVGIEEPARARLRLVSCAGRNIGHRPARLCAARAAWIVEKNGNGLDGGIVEVKCSVESVGQPC